MNRFFLKVNGELHCPRKICRPKTASQWEGGEVFIPINGPIHVASDGTTSLAPVQNGDELWIWTHEDDNFGRGWGLTAKATAGDQAERNGFLAITLRNVERLPRPFGFRNLGEGPYASNLLNRVHGHRHHQAYLFDEVEFRDFLRVVEEWGMPLAGDVRYAGETEWAREIRNNKNEIIEDLAKRRRSTQKVRPEQARFRAELMSLYGGRCVLTGNSIPEALEAAHVLPHNGDPIRDQPENGLLLRRDLHSMFDAMLWSIDPERGIVVLSNNLVDRSYQIYDGKRIAHKVASEPLKVHFKQFQKALKDV